MSESEEIKRFKAKLKEQKSNYDTVNHKLASKTINLEKEIVQLKNDCPSCGKSKWTNWQNCLRCNKEAYKGMQETRRYCLRKMKRMEIYKEILEKRVP